MLNVYDILSSQDERYKKLSFKDHLFVHYQCPQIDQYLKMYTHLNYILYVVKGKKIFHQPGKSFLLTEGVCAFIKKGGVKQERFFDEDWDVMVFFMPDQYLSQFINEYRDALPISLKPVPVIDHALELNVNDTTRGVFESMLPYFIQTPRVSEQLVELKFKELLFNLLSNSSNSLLLSNLNLSNDKGIPMLAEIMEANYIYNLSLAEFARISYRSLSAFKREFAEIFHTSPGKWLLQKRLDHAQLLLTTSLKNVNEIATESGFENDSHFNRVFRDRFGLPPLQYRKSSAVQ